MDKVNINKLLIEKMTYNNDTLVSQSKNLEQVSVTGNMTSR